MTNKEILEEVYKRLGGRSGHGFSHDSQSIRAIRSFIEQEWQRADEEERTKWEDDHPLTKWDEGQMYNTNEQDVNENSAGGGAHGHFSQSWYKKTYKMPDGYSVDQGGALDERHRGLEIGEDGTVKGFTDE